MLAVPVSPVDSLVAILLQWDSYASEDDIGVFRNTDDLYASWYTPALAGVQTNPVRGINARERSFALGCAPFANFLHEVSLRVNAFFGDLRVMLGAADRVGCMTATTVMSI